jgi:hypothetical protein
MNHIRTVVTTAIFTQKGTTQLHRVGSEKKITIIHKQARSAVNEEIIKKMGRKIT